LVALRNRTRTRTPRARDAGSTDNPSDPITVEGPLAKRAGRESFAGGNGVQASAGRSANPSPEVCDGVDNDANGIIDDLDAQHDGVLASSPRKRC
jgi:hypothetical protein